MDLKERNARQRRKCVAYMQAKKGYCKGRFGKNTLIKQKDKVKLAMPAGKYFGHTPQVFLDEIALIDTCLANWDEYIAYVN